MNVILKIVRNGTERRIDLTPFFYGAKTENAWEESKHPRDEDGRFGKSGKLSISSQKLLKGKNKEEFREHMLKLLQNFNGKVFKNSSLGADIEIRTSSVKKYKSFSADVKKLYVIPSIPSLLEKAVFSKTEKPYDKRETSIKAYFKAYVDIEIDGEPYVVHITVKKDQKGNYFWDAQIK